MAECLHCEINKLVEDYVATGPQPADLAEMVAMMAQSLGELVLAGPADHQATLMGEALATLGAIILDKPEEGESERPHRSH